MRYTDDDAAEQIRRIAPKGVEQIVEVAPGANARLDLQVIANHASIAYYANEGGDEIIIPVQPSFAKNLRVQGVLVYTVGEAAWRAAAEDVTAALRDGALPVGEEAGLPLTWFPLAETAAAHDAVEGGAVGKVLIEVTPAIR